MKNILQYLRTSLENGLDMIKSVQASKRDVQRSKVAR